MRILIIEDNRDGADSLRLLLELLGHEACVAYSGQEGVRLAIECHPALVLSDIGMPGMDGFDVARALRHNESLNDAKLVAFTAYGSDEIKQRARDSGFDLVFTKPNALDGLLTLLAGNQAQD